MADKKVESQEERQAGLAPEMHNDEQDDHRDQAQEVSEQARDSGHRTASPLESKKSGRASDILGNAEPDTIDRMKEMEQSGRIDMDAYRGEPNLDDNEDKYDPSNKVDKDLPSDGSGQKSQGSRT